MLAVNTYGQGQETRQQFPQMPWPQMISMRNRLIHAYFEIDFDQVWLAATQDAPALAASLRRIIAAADEAS
jgi:uncharacterized protein with HEPN domain